MRILINRIGLLVVIVMALTTVACGSEKTGEEPSHASQKQEKSLTVISLKDIQEKMEKQDDFYLYIGRPTCPYCQQFYPKLMEVVAKGSQEVYYLNTDEEGKEKAKSYFSQYQLTTIPSLSHFSGGELIATLENGSQASVKEISDWLTQNKSVGLD